MSIKTTREKKRIFSRQVEEPYKINQKIVVSEVRLVGDNVKVGIYPLEEALRIANTQALDLVEISPNVEPPICKVLDYAKFKYEQKKKQKQIKAKAQKVIIKEIRFGPNTDEHDFTFKLNHAINFLQDGVRLKVYVKFVGRQIIFKERGELLLLKFAQSLEKYGKVEQLPKLEGKRLILNIVPKKLK